MPRLVIRSGYTGLIRAKSAGFSLFYTPFGVKSRKTLKLKASRKVNEEARKERSLTLRALSLPQLIARNLLHEDAKAHLRTPVMGHAPEKRCLNV